MRLSEDPLSDEEFAAVREAYRKASASTLYHTAVLDDLVEASIRDLEAIRDGRLVDPVIRLQLSLSEKQARVFAESLGARADRQREALAHAVLEHTSALSPSSPIPPAAPAGPAPDLSSSAAGEGGGSRSPVCPDCFGSGKSGPWPATCLTCAGEGRIGVPS